MHGIALVDEDGADDSTAARAIRPFSGARADKAARRGDGGSRLEQPRPATV
jgi:hypothetical protein